VEEVELSELDFCYVITTGRSSGRPHTIEIWFALRDARIYVLSGGGDASDWVKNIRVNPTVGLRIGDRDMICRAYVVEGADEDALARRLLMEKYRPRYTGDLDEWRETSLPVAFVLPED
jgi:deazaflavin-dependent oxidoreductase (nitroreductase family)